MHRFLCSLPYAVAQPLHSRCGPFPARPAALWNVHAADVIKAGLCGRVIFLQADSLLFGALLALSLRAPSPPSAAALSRGASRVAKGVLAGILVFSLVYVRVPALTFALHHVEPLLDALGYTCIDIVAVALIILAIDPRTWVSRVLQHPALMRLGMVSYGFYVFHELPHMAYARLAGLLPSAFNPFGILTAAFALAGTLALSMLSFRYFEPIFLRWTPRSPEVPSLPHTSDLAPTSSSVASDIVLA